MREKVCAEKTRFRVARELEIKGIIVIVDNGNSFAKAARANGLLSSSPHHQPPSQALWSALFSVSVAFTPKNIQSSRQSHLECERAWMNGKHGLCGDNDHESEWKSVWDYKRLFVQVIWEQSEPPVSLLAGIFFGQGLESHATGFVVQIRVGCGHVDFTFHLITTRDMRLAHFARSGAPVSFASHFIDFILNPRGLESHRSFNQTFMEASRLLVVTPWRQPQQSCSKIEASIWGFQFGPPTAKPCELNGSPFCELSDLIFDQKVIPSAIQSTSISTPTQKGPTNGSAFTDIARKISTSLCYSGRHFSPNRLRVSIRLHARPRRIKQRCQFFHCFLCLKVGKSCTMSLGRNKNTKKKHTARHKQLCEETSLHANVVEKQQPAVLCAIVTHQVRREPRREAIRFVSRAFLRQTCEKNGRRTRRHNCSLPTPYRLTRAPSTSSLGTLWPKTLPLPYSPPMIVVLREAKWKKNARNKNCFQLAQQVALKETPKRDHITF